MATRKFKGLFMMVCAVLCFILFSAASAFAENIVLTNKGKEISLTYSIIESNEEHYIALEDFGKINLSYTGEDNEIFVFRKYAERYGRHEELYKHRIDIKENILDGESGVYQNVLLTVNNVRYISIAALAGEFSDKYELNGNNINLHINDYLTKKFTITVSLPDDVIVPQEGFPVTLYSGLKDPHSGGGTSSGGGGYTSYMGTHINIPSATDFTGIEKLNLTKKQTVKKVIPYGARSVSAELDVAWNSYGGESYVAYIGYYIDNQYYWGNGKVSFQLSYSGDRNITFTASCTAKKYITGNITVPQHTEELSYTVVAEADRKLDFNENGSYHASRSYTFKSSETIPEDVNEVSYSLAVLGDKDYYVYIVFSNGEYIRQSHEIKNLTENTQVNFNSFKPSNKVNGKIKLPEEVNYEGVSEVSATVCLQSASAPYYYLDEYNVTIDTETKSADFTLTDEIGTDSVIVYYYIGWIENLYENGICLYHTGTYKDNTKCVSNVKYSQAILPECDDIVLNITKGKRIDVALALRDCDFDGGISELSSVLQKSVNAEAIDSEEVEEYLMYDYSEEDNGLEIEKRYFILPEDYEYYVLKMYHSLSDKFIYITENGLAEDISKAKLYSSNDIEVNLSYNGYEPDIPFETDVNYEQGEGINISIVNKYDKIYLDNAKCYFAFYKSNEGLYRVKTENISLESCGEDWIVLPETEYNTTEKIRLIILDENLRPLAACIDIK